LIEPSVYNLDRISAVDAILDKLSHLEYEKYIFHIIGSNSNKIIIGEVSDGVGSAIMDISSMLEEAKFSEYNIAAELHLVSDTLKREQLSSDETLLIILGDLVYVGVDGVSSHGYFFNDTWLTSDYSPFVRYLIKKDNKWLSGLRVAVFGQQSSSAYVYKKSKSFMAKLFNLVEPSIKLLFYSPLLNTFNRGNTGYFSRLLFNLSESTFPIVKPGKIESTLLFQLVSDEKEVVDVDINTLRRYR